VFLELTDCVKTTQTNLSC